MIVSKFHPKIFPFSKLPQHCQLAIVWWMVVNERIWVCSEDIVAAKNSWNDEKLLKLAVKNSLAFYNSKYGKECFGMASIPIKIFMNGISDVTGDSFEEYHSSFCMNHRVEDHPKRHRWPLIINPETGSIHDGYHRFHTYVNQGVNKVGCIWLV